MSLFSLDGQVAIITGGNGGIGYAMAEALGENGSHAGQMRLAIKENTLISTIDISNEIQKRINISKCTIQAEFVSA